MGCNRDGMPVSVFRRQDFYHLRLLFLLLLIAIGARCQRPYRRLYMHRLFEIAVNGFAVSLSIAMGNLNTVHGRASGGHGRGPEPWARGVGARGASTED